MFRFYYFAFSVFVAFCNAEEFETAPLTGGRIAGGSDAYIYDFPHHVSIHYRGIHRCSGSIYSENIIIASTSWMSGTNVSDFTIVAGSTFLSSPNIEIAVRKKIVHPNYSSWTTDYNIAILVLDGLLRFRPAVQPIALAKERPPVGTIATVTGWGSADGSNDLINQLQKVDVTVMSKFECFKAYDIYYTKRFLCAAAPGGGKAACYRDEGGPLVVNKELLGIVSHFGTNCVRGSEPNVYTSVPDLYDWIVETAQNNAIPSA